jgi:hypothetical protein
VKHLLNTHNPDLKQEDFDQKILLALVCEAKPLRWGKVANSEADFRTRQKETMQLLAPRTSAKWRFRHRTVLHIAIGNGLETTKAMVEALNIRNDLEKLEQYIYMDKGEKEYLPREYVMKFVEATPAQKASLVECLIGAGLKPPGHGSDGYGLRTPSIGSPPSYTEA